jgi:hypothetical protein
MSGERKGLYQSGYRPVALPKRFEATSISIGGDGQAADVMRRYSIPETWGDPVDAVAFFDDDSGELKALVADYANGKRAELRLNACGSMTEDEVPCDQWQAVNDDYPKCWSEGSCWASNADCYTSDQPTAWRYP